MDVKGVAMNEVIAEAMILTCSIKAGSSRTSPPSACRT